MSLVIGINKSKQISKWCEYKDDKGNVLAEFEINGIDYKPYKVAIERASNQISSNGFNVETATTENKLYHELLLDACACHLIKNWKKVTFSIDGEETEMPYTPENAMTLLNMGDIGVAIWHFVKTESEKMQKEADAFKVEMVGKSNSSTDGQNMEMKEQPREA